MQTHNYPILHKDLRHKRNFIWYVVLALLFWEPHTLFADLSTLERIAAAESKASYIGIRLKTFISPRGTHTQEEMVIHISPDVTYGKELSVVGERKSFEGPRDDERRDENRRDNRRRNRDESHRNGRDRDHEQHKWDQVRSLFSQKDVKLIAQNYNLEKSSSTEKIANYETDLLTIIPKFLGRPTYRIFFARENGVILRAEILDTEGVLWAMFVYTRISFDVEAVERKWDVFEKEIKPEPQRSHSISLAEGEKILKTEPIQPEYLPPGFHLQDIHGIKDKKNTIHLIYTDGLLGFSIFETTDKRARRGSEKRRGSEVVEFEGTRVHKHQRGPTHAFSWSSADIHFFLFGAMPADEMQKVVESIIHNTKENKE